MTTIACVLITHLRYKAEVQRCPRLKNQSLLITEADGGHARVVDHSPDLPAGVLGATLERALGLQPQAAVLEADEPHYRQVFRSALDALLEVGDRVEAAELGAAYVGINGLEAMYGGEARLVTTLLNAVPPWLNPRIGVGEGKFPALVAARTSPARGATRVPPDAAAFLSPHSVDLLPVAAGTREALHRFGLHSLGQVAALEPNRLVDRFGRDGGTAWNLAHGNDDSPLAPLKREETVAEWASLPFSSNSLELLLVAVDTLLRRAYARPEIRGRRVGKVVLECAVFRAAPWQRTIVFQEGVNHWERAAFIIRSRLEAEPPRAPVDDLTLTLSDLTGESGAQPGLLPGARETRERRLAEVERRLPARRSGSSTLYRVVNVAPWHPAPELRAVQAPLDRSGDGSIRPLFLPEPVAVREGPGRQPAAIGRGSHWHPVDSITERWSFDLWWQPKPLTKTYYRVKREDGKSLVLFRDRKDGCWYQQGR